MGLEYRLGGCADIFAITRIFSVDSVVVFWEFLDVELWLEMTREARV